MVGCIQDRTRYGRGKGLAMKFEVGINANPTNGIVPYDVQGLSYARFPYWIVQNRYYDYNPFINGVLDQGMYVQVCFDSRTFPDSDYIGTLQRIKDRNPRIDWIQTGLNEFDNRSESSSYATPARVDRIIEATRRVFGDNIFITAPAVVSGNGPAKLRQLKNLHLCNALAFHPYGIRPDQDFPTEDWGFGYIGDVLSIYQQIANAHGLQVECSEIGFDKTWFVDDEHSRAQCHSRMLLSLASLGAHRAAVFTLPYIAHPHFSLLDENGHITESYAAVWNAGPTITVNEQQYIPMQEYEQGRVVGNFRHTPHGAILHGSRSGINRPVSIEYTSTVGYVRRGTNGIVGWNFTIGDDIFCKHMDTDQWGYHARAASDEFLGFEFAQGTESNDITDAQVRAFCYVWKYDVEMRYPGIVRNFITHYAAERAGLTGVRDGKTDVFSNADRANELKARIHTTLAVI